MEPELYEDGRANWICAKHWALVPRDLKRLLARHRRQERRYGAIVRPMAHGRLWRAIYRILNDGR